MDTQTRYPRRMPRGKWTPPTPDLAQGIDHVIALYEKWKADEAEYKRALAELAQPVGPVPIAHFAERLGVERKTVYRHLGRSMT